MRPHSAQGIARNFPDDLGFDLLFRGAVRESAVGSSGRGVTQAGEAQVGVRSAAYRVKMPAVGGAVLTKEILFGMNILSLAGFLVMGLSLTLRRIGNAGVPLSIGRMCAGTALVFYGLFVGNSSK
jgi:hypothetical protein